MPFLENPLENMGKESLAASPTIEGTQPQPSPPTVPCSDRYRDSMASMENSATFIMSSQEAAERKGADVNNRDEAIVGTLLTRSDCGQMPFAAGRLPDEMMKVAENSTKPLGCRPQLPPPKPNDSHSNGPSIQTTVLSILKNKGEAITKKTLHQAKDLQEIQESIFQLDGLFKAINKATAENGGLDLSKEPELQKLLETVQERVQTIQVGKDAGKLDLEIDRKKMKYSREERALLVQNIEKSVDTLNVLARDGLREMEQLTTIKNEFYQYARTIMKTIHEAIIAGLKAIRG